ncbi:MAG TPA: hypothetical protein VNA24_32665, partial [Hyalangium sp.]|nr:hypothetical protein [Hyalangium sp.]
APPAPQEQPSKGVPHEGPGSAPALAVPCGCEPLAAGSPRRARGAGRFDYQGQRYHVEYDSPTSGRGPAHQSRLTNNDPDAIILRIIIPEE